MRLSVFHVLVLVVLVFLVRVQVEADDGNATHYYITWDDFKVDDGMLGSNGARLSSHGGGRVIVVDQDGNGDSETVQGAVHMVPENNTERVKIYIYPGVYRERVYVPKSKPFISFIGKQNLNLTAIPIITNNTKASDKGSDGKEVGMVNTATVWVESDYFCATAVTFENTAVIQNGDGDQAVALRVDGDKAVFFRVRIVGQQDTLFDNTGTHYFYRSYIQGAVDFICGKAKSLFEECLIYSVADYGSITAHQRDAADEDSGFSFVSSTIKGTGNILLGRAWGGYSRIIYSLCHMDDIIIPEGWDDWGVVSRQNTVVFGEHGCSGGGADRSGRVKWSKSLSYEEALPFMSRAYINGKSWLRL